MLIFLHLPKTGGSTLTPIVDWNYNDRVYKLSLYSEIPAFINLSDSEKAQYESLAGQVFYGIHRYIPADCQYIAMMRHPYDRVVSQYYYLNVRKKKLGEPLTDITLEEFLAQEPFQATMQLNLIAGGDDMHSTLHQPVTEATLQRAIDNIEQHFAVVGDLAHYNESVLLMKRHLGWSRAYYTRQNTNPGHATFDDLPASTRQTIREACTLELKLYEYVQQRLQQQIDAEDESFRKELQQMQHRSKYLQQLHRLAGPLRHTKLWFWMRSVAKRLLP
jgi:hypothetical protein